MNVLDIGVLIVIALSGVLAFSRGFGKEALSLAGWILSAVLTFHLFYPASLPLAMSYVPSELLARFAAASVPFVLSLFVMALLSAWIRALCRSIFVDTAMGALNRSLGFLFGLLRGGIILSLVYLLFIWAFPRIEDQPAFVRQARTVPLLDHGARVLVSLLPSGMSDIAKGAFGSTDQAIDKAKTLNNAYKILNPPSPSQPADNTPDGKTGSAIDPQTKYKENERNDLQRLIEGSGQ